LNIIQLKNDGLV